MAERSGTSLRRLESNTSEKIVNNCDSGSANRRGVPNRTSSDEYHNNQQSCNNHYEPPTNSNLVEFLKSKLFVSIFIISALFITLLCIGLVISFEKENDVTHSIDAWKDKLSPQQSVWFESGLNELKRALKIQINTRRAKNVILFVGDGMGPASVTAARIYKYGEGGRLSWEDFPHMGLLKTYCMDKQVPDSTSTATALFGGVKGNYETGGVDAAVTLANCTASQNEVNHVESIIHWAQNAGMGTGFVTTTRVMHATPAGLYAHVADRRWECDDTLTDDAKMKGCKDIARQLIEDEPGRNINVIMGGGRQCLVSDVAGTTMDPIDTWACRSKDGRNLIEKWKSQKQLENKRFAVLSNNSDLINLDVTKDYVLGIFANGHLSYDHERNRGPSGMPSLADMTAAAIRLLKRHSKGFVLVVEGGMIDQAHHRGWAKRALSEVATMDDAIQESMNLMSQNMDETLIIVTSDHAHTLSINGYPARGNNIFGLADISNEARKIPYTTLTYGTGGPGASQIEIGQDGKAQRRDPSTDDTTAYDYVQQVAVETDENTHGGVDVGVYAIGPMAHLFHRVHEQSYVAHVISYAARIGRFRDTSTSGAIFDFLGL